MAGNRLRASFALVLLASCVSAQTTPRRPASAKPAPAVVRTSERIVSVQVHGSKLYTSAEIVPLTGLRAGMTFDRAGLEAARGKLVETNLFSEVSGEYKTSNKGGATIAVDITFEVVDAPLRYTVHFDRLGKPDAELQALLHQKVPLYREPMPYSTLLLDQVKAALAPVTGPVAARITGDTPTEQFLLIHPEGKPPVIAEVKFSGGDVIPNDELVFAMRGAAVGIEYREALFRELLKLGAVGLVYLTKKPDVIGHSVLLGEGAKSRFVIADAGD